MFEGSSAVSIQNLRKSFDGGKEFVLNGLNLDIPKGVITVLIGYSGTGKSVLMKHILGLLKPTSGVVEVLGKDLWSMSDEELVQYRCRLGVLFQHAALFDDMTVLENVCFPLKEHRREMSPSAIVDEAVKKLQMSGMEEKHFAKLPGELSGGMRKRVGLARALALDPEIILYDEPTTGLDPILTEMVDNLILETHRLHKGSTSVIVSHDLFAAFRIGEHIAMLDKGKVLLSGTVDEFLNSDVDLVKRFVDKGFYKK
ncbi:MAG: ATP-binding cassette domain-containing protein [Bdellovibrionaceae bacterium]|nr:ATP-binding cassette domain-containing protein [Bdellovibrionales bacterium]MCB9084744.1 ATP-binding cassette domain-containing protein [Pseudobdellovibrionaceae bacterium]